jgi:L-2-hydroxyglutarate oxidase
MSLALSPNRDETPMGSSFDVAVIGGGIVGMATAMALVEGGGRSLVVLEAEDQLAAHQSGRNSGVIHSGLYYQPGSLKARTCRTGREALYQFCIEEGVACRRCGKLVVATKAHELPILDELERRGRANGLTGLRRVAGRALRDLEPEVAGLAGLWVAETGVVDFAQVTNAYARRVQVGGGAVWTGARVTAVRREAGQLLIETTRGEVRAGRLVNCAGLSADRVAQMCGVDPGVRIVPFRGEYYELVAERRRLVKNLIYPVPDPTLPFLGVHLTRTIDDRVEAGPNAVLALKREGYSPWIVSPRDLAGMLSFPGFWRMAGRHWRRGWVEWRRSVSKRQSVRALQQLLPGLRPHDIVRGRRGVRAQAVDRAGRLLDDLYVLQSDDALHVLNAPSPAATASLSIGRNLANRLGV